MPMTRSHEAVVESQFGPQADAYVKSAVHASGEDLDMLEEIVRRSAPSRALDLGAGGGHVTYRLARHATTVTACDLSADMLAAVAATARERRLSNVEIRVARAEALPFDTGAFDFLGCRFSAHHWRRFDAGLAEARRVLADGAPAIFIDAISTGPAATDTHLQAVELLRDPSHVRDYRAAEWLEALDRASFSVRAARTWRLRMDFPTWIGRMRTPPVNEQAIRALQRSASAEVIDHFAVEADGSFLLDTLLLEAVAR
jgi:ubiquinone/menaquinone biosynthesis C-methylase UbiE